MLPAVSPSATKQRRCLLQGQHGGLCYNRRRPLLQRVATTATSGDGDVLHMADVATNDEMTAVVAANGGGRCYKRRRPLLQTWCRRAARRSARPSAAVVAANGSGRCYKQGRRRAARRPVRPSVAVVDGGCYKRRQPLLQFVRRHATQRPARTSAGLPHAGGEGTCPGQAVLHASARRCCQSWAAVLVS
jgi:hypothetical protein